MDFRRWVENADRVDRLLCRLIDCHASIVGLAHDLSLITEADAKNPPKSLMASLRKRFSSALRDTWHDELEDPTSPINWAARGVRWIKGRGGKKKEEPAPSAPAQPPHEETPDKKMDRLSNELQVLTMRGYHDNDPEWSAQYRSLMGQIHALSDEIAQKSGSAPHTVSPSPAATSDAQVRIQKAKGAIATLRDVLKDPKFEPILSHLEQEVGMMGKPGFYHNMGTGEKAWYDKLGDEDRSKFDAEMSRSGDQAINHGDEWWNVAAQRAQKAASQGYQDADANWRWAAGYANRQRIRRSMNPEWEKQLQGEALTPGGKMFREWLKKRVSEAAVNGADGVGADTPGNVTAPTDPKEIARRKAVSDIASAMMKKNPKLKPGGADQQTVANAVSTDPKLSKADPDTQKAVSSYFLGDK